MEREKHERVVSGNKELRRLRRMAEDVANGTRTVPDVESQSLSQRLSNRDFSVGEASRSETLDAELRSEIAEYVDDLRALQTAIERANHVTLARRRQLKATQPDSDEDREWASPYQRATSSE